MLSDAEIKEIESKAVCQQHGPDYWSWRFEKFISHGTDKRVQFWNLLIQIEMNREQAAHISD